MTLRADARRNRARILEAAEKVLVERGTTVSTEEIARAAGVGVGTLFRHFPTKEELIQGVFVARLHRLADDAFRLAESSDPGKALTSFLRQAVAQGEVKNALAAMLTSAGVDLQEAAGEVHQEVRRALGTLLRSAQETGAVRRDLEVSDLIGLLAGTSRAIEYAGSDVTARDRILAVVLDGLRPPSPAGWARRDGPADGTATAQPAAGRAAPSPSSGQADQTSNGQADQTTSGQADQK
ncbi:TetR/AcrR family transcriptional regulator [Actinoplanes sp. KI2]|uniref:TetR/AcrR family transcriptional regulator n=1 Tax=Actinoplanes sp. KI2 TaxID=2983315 RepID=UPI0021D5B614|nr:TetR/AcrR family transcriptional regulator [Actinoplanes sp. KI2]MCU7726172.1 TetR/AcrR family transcriptional regulator [Actinoplanes sp. KI2]